MSKIWQKPSLKNINSLIEEYTVWNDYILDLDLVKYDVQWSIAHAKMLKKIWVLNNKELNILLEWLANILKLSEAWKFEIRREDEDCHTAIEAYLINECGEVGKKIHTARSRNDQILVTVRLFTKEKLEEIIDLIRLLITTFDNKIKEIWTQKMPGYTHTQRAMPTTIWMWLWSFRDSLIDDLILLEASYKIINQNPLWSVASFWEDVFNIDKSETTKLLKFNKTQENPMYCAYSRWKFESIVLQSLSQVMMDLWKLANDMVLFSSREFNFLTLPNTFKTWSSVMPQKKNWDVMELVRWNSNLFLGYEYSIKEIFKNLLSWYNRDYQLTKEPFMKWINLSISTIKICDLIVSELGLNTDNLDSACTEELYATREAYLLVKDWMSFRDAYRIVWDKYV